MQDEAQGEWEKTYTTMSAVCSSSLFRCLVDLDVLDDQVTGVKSFSVRIGFGVLEEAE